MNDKKAWDVWFTSHEGVARRVLVIAKEAHTVFAVIENMGHMNSALRLDFDSIIDTSVGEADGGRPLKII